MLRYTLGECQTYDCRVSFHCDEGYELVGKAERICLADGTWAPKELPQCVQVGPGGKMVPRMKSAFISTKRRLFFR